MEKKEEEVDEEAMLSRWRRRKRKLKRKQC
jgi:hypothetical protein